MRNGTVPEDLPTRNATNPQGRSLYLILTLVEIKQFISLQETNVEFSEIKINHYLEVTIWPNIQKTYLLLKCCVSYHRHIAMYFIFYKSLSSNIFYFFLVNHTVYAHKCVPAWQEGCTNLSTLSTSVRNEKMCITYKGVWKSVCAYVCVCVCMYTSYNLVKYT